MKMQNAAWMLGIALAAVPAFGAITGTVINQTTGKPQAGATVGFNKLGQNGIELIDQAKSGADGKFVINQTPEGPCLLRTAFEGVQYLHMMPPGSPSTDLKVEVYDVTKTPGAAKVSKHMIQFQPAGGQMAIREIYLFENPGKTAWYDADAGTLHFYMPESAGGKATAQATAPGGMPIGVAIAAAGTADTYKVDFAIKPGESEVDLSYTVPYTEGAEYAGKVISKDENTYLIAPQGVTLAADGLNDLGVEPRSQSHIYGLAKNAYKVKLTGTAIATQPDDANGGGDQQENGPQIEQIMPRLYGMTVPILGLALGILAIGFVLLYRSKTNAGQESDERRRG